MDRFRRMWLAVPVIPLPTVRVPALRLDGRAGHGATVLYATRNAALVTLLVAAGFGAGWLMAVAGI